MSGETVKCTRCGVFDVPAPQSLEEDPVCPQCLREMVAKAADAVFGRKVDQPPTTAVDWNEMSLHPAMTGEEINAARRENPYSLVHPDVAASFEETVGQICRRMTGAPEYAGPVREFNNDEGGCPGYDDSCPNMLAGAEDLCPACSAKRDADDVDPSLTPAGYAPDGLGAPRDEDETVQGPQFVRRPRRPLIKCRECGHGFEGKLSDRVCPDCRDDDGDSTYGLGYYG